MIFNVYRPPWAVIAFEGEDEGAGPKGDDKDKEIEEWRTENTKLVDQLQALVTRLDAVEGRPAHDPAAAEALRTEIKELKTELEALKKAKPRAPTPPKSPTPPSPPPKSGADDPPAREPAPDRKPRRTLARL